MCPAIVSDENFCEEPSDLVADVINRTRTDRPADRALPDRASRPDCDRTSPLAGLPAARTWCVVLGVEEVDVQSPRPTVACGSALRESAESIPRPDRERMSVRRCRDRLGFRRGLPLLSASCLGG